MWVFVSLVALAFVVATGWYAFIRSVETPPFHLVTKDGVFEVRDYAEQVAAEVVRTGSREQAVQRGFRPLAGYIFAKDRPGEKVAMTAPVVQEPEDGSSTSTATWRVRFIMPSAYTKDSLPQPIGEVRLTELPARRMAVIRFSGRADTAMFERELERLRNWIDRQGLRPEGGPTLAYYDDPLVPGPLRRNEVMVPVVQTNDDS